MLTRAPGHLASKGEPDRVGRNELNERRAVRMVRAAPSAVVPYETRGPKDAIERPYNECRPEVVSKPEPAGAGRDQKMVSRRYLGLGWEAVTHSTSRAWKYPQMMKILYT